MKKIFLTLILATAITSLFAQATEPRTLYVMKNGEVAYQSVVAEIDSIIFYNPSAYNPADGVLINGVVWAKYNVDAPGTFAATPESAGKFYQWNRKVAWAATGSVSGWSDTDAAGTTWVKANDPSPAGWRVPTYAEQQTLLDTEKVTREWTIQNGVNGYKFTDKTTNNSLFLPAAGYRNGSAGTLNGAGSDGYYWSSSQLDSDSAYYLYFYSGSADWYRSGFRRYGFSVRAVAE